METIQLASLFWLGLTSSFCLTSQAWSTGQQACFRHRSYVVKLCAERPGGNSVIVVSPPGGVGEVSAVKAAELGNSVRWFVVFDDADDVSKSDVVLSQEALDRVANSGGSVEIAGATAKSLLLAPEDLGSALPAIGTWCGAADALICCTDGVIDKRKKKAEEDPTVPWNNAIKLAAKEVASYVKGIKIAVVPVADSGDLAENENQGNGIGISNLLGGLIGGRRTDIPSSVTEAMGASNLIRLRHGRLFGIPDSSPDFSPFVGGPRREPELCKEFANAAVRVDSTIAVSGNRMTGTQSSRHAVGQAAALIVTGQIPVPHIESLDVCVSSQPGTAPVTLDEWKSEFARVDKMMIAGEAATLFETEFSSVPDTDRLADWLATKWAPAVLRTYDIAAIRTGERPVFASRIEAGVEIVWQQLVNFDSVVVGKMIIQVSDTGIKAIRGPGDAKTGFGAVSSKPLAGEDILVRRLAEAASQAVEKGLAMKSIPNKKKINSPSIAPEPIVVSSTQSPGPFSSKPVPSASSTSPRQSTARRSTERARGTKRKQPSPKK